MCQLQQLKFCILHKQYKKIKDIELKHGRKQKILGCVYGCGFLLCKEFNRKYGESAKKLLLASSLGMLD